MSSANQITRLVCKDGEKGFAKFLEREMRIRGLNQSQLATYAGIRPSAVNGWFNRGSMPSYATCLKLAKALKLDATVVLAAAGDERRSSGLR